MRRKNTVIRNIAAIETRTAVIKKRVVVIRINIEIETGVIGTNTRAAVMRKSHHHLETKIRKKNTRALQRIRTISPEIKKKIERRIDIKVTKTNIVVIKISTQVQRIGTG